MHTKDETIAFLGYLKRKDPIVLESDLIVGRTFFNAFMKNIYAEAAPLSDIIRKSPSVGDAYRYIAHRYAKRNSLWPTFPELAYIFSEDLIEHMNVEDDSEKAELTEKLRLMDFAGCDLKKHLPISMTPWIDNGVTLCSRDVLFESFPTEYQMFLHEHYEPSGSTFTISEHDASEGAFNGYRIEAEKWKRMMGEAKLRENLEDNRIFMGYDSSKHTLDNETLIAVAKLICESSPITQVRFCDYATLKTLVVRKNSAPTAPNKAKNCK